MASSLKVTEEHFNYLKVCLIAKDELAEGLGKSLNENGTIATRQPWENGKMNRKMEWTFGTENRL